MMSKLEFKSNDNSKKYEVEIICNSIVYNKELKSGYFLGLYYLIF